MVCITCCNSVSSDEPPFGGLDGASFLRRRVKEGDTSGLGLKIVEENARRYHGSLQIIPTAEKFTVIVLLKKPSVTISEPLVT